MTDLAPRNMMNLATDTGHAGLSRHRAPRMSSSRPIGSPLMRARHDGALNPLNAGNTLAAPSLHSVPCH